MSANIYIHFKCILQHTWISGNTGISGRGYSLPSMNTCRQFTEYIPLKPRNLFTCATKPQHLNCGREANKCKLLFTFILDNVYDFYLIMKTVILLIFLLLDSIFLSKQLEGPVVLKRNLRATDKLYYFNFRHILIL